MIKQHQPQPWQASCNTVLLGSSQVEPSPTKHQTPTPADLVDLVFRVPGPISQSGEKWRKKSYRLSTF